MNGYDWMITWTRKGRGIFYACLLGGALAGTFAGGESGVRAEDRYERRRLGLPARER